ncbi:aminoacyl-tRNA hydrolase [Methylocella sp.]|uniref:aminoacyl-tRNA hydrolase n=1 Tax=Methylocella sp. TaxID=1978226 RepID=UPI003783CEA6
MLLFVGLGNPGRDYAKNRHNIGFMAIDRIARDYSAPPLRQKHQGLASEALIGGERVLLLEPQTYMNESGRSVSEAARFLKIPVNNVVVFHDELDLPPGKVRVKTGGGSAGHNGLKSITAHLGPDYRRVRLGIGHPGDKALVTHYVLGDFAKSEAGWLDELMHVVAANAPLLAKGEDDGFQTKIFKDMSAAGF